MIKSCRQLFFIISVALLTACSRDTRTTDINECTAQTQREMSNDPSASRALANQSDEQRHDVIGNMISVCMEQRGYKHDDGAMTDGRCVDDVDYNPYCYLKGE
jgi:hypothetical protein